jgi:hypothetical protein
MKVSYANGDVLSASDVNDTNGTINLLGGSLAYSAGKNKFLNSDFRFWQRGTSFTGFSTGQFFADRFSSNFNGSAATRTVSQQTFTPATAPASGYEGLYYLRYAQSVAGTGGSYNQLKTWIEDVRSVTPGQTYTLSFWAKAAAAKNIDVQFGQSFGSGGSGDVETTVKSAQALTTSWVRYSYSFTVPSISGKTVGNGSYAFVYLGLPNNDTFTIDTWGWQLEQGSTATAFQTATGTIQGELAACQRYYAKSYNLATAPATSTTDSIVIVSQKSNLANVDAVGPMTFPVKMRTAPTVTIYSFTGATAKVSDIGGTDKVANSGATYGLGDQYGYVYNNSATTISPSGGGFMWHYTASAEL